MKINYCFITFIFITIFTLNSIYAQPLTNQLLGVTSGNYQNVNLSFYWSVGEVITETFSSGNTYLTSGFHQPNYYFSSIKSKEFSHLTFLVYPNPFSDNIYCKINQDENYIAKIFDITGKLIKYQYLSQSENTINLSNQSSGNYLITIFNIDEKEISTFKIFKLK